MNIIKPFNFDLASEEYHFAPCPHLPGSSRTTSFVCTHHMVIFGTESGHIHFHKIIDTSNSLHEENSSTIEYQQQQQQPLSYPSIDPDLLKAVAIAPAGVASSCVKAMAISPCHSRLACLTLDGTLHVLQLYYTVNIVDDGELEASSDGHFTPRRRRKSSSSSSSHAPAMLDVRRIGGPIALSSQVVVMPVGSNSETDLSATTVLVTGPPRARPTTRRLVLTPSATTSTLLWTDNRTILVGCAKHAAVVAVVLSRPPFLGNVWIGKSQAGHSTGERERTERIIATDCSMPVASKVLLLTYDPLESAELLQLQLGLASDDISPEGVSNRGIAQWLAITTEARSTIVRCPNDDESEVGNGGSAGASRDDLTRTSTAGSPSVNLAPTFFTADALLQRAFGDPEKSSVILEIDPPLKAEDDVQRIMNKASTLWKGLINDIANADTPSQMPIGRRYAPLFHIVQIGQKPRDEGYFGATIASPILGAPLTATLTSQGQFDCSPVPNESENPNGSLMLRMPFLESSGQKGNNTNRLYSARHNQRVFEADGSGRVLKTLRYEPRESDTNPYAAIEDVPLGLLAGLPAGFDFRQGAAGILAPPQDTTEEDSTHEEDPCYIWSESPTFAAVVKVSDTTGCSCCWALITEEPPEEEEQEGVASELCFDILSSCPFRHNQFRFVLCSNGKLLIVPIMPRIPIHQRVFDVYYVMLRPAARAPASPTVPDVGSIPAIPSPRREAITPSMMPSGQSPAATPATEDLDDENGKKKKKKVVVVKKVVKKKGALIAKETETKNVEETTNEALENSGVMQLPDDIPSTYTSYASPQFEGSTAEPSNEGNIDNTATAVDTSVVTGNVSGRHTPSLQDVSSPIKLPAEIEPPIVVVAEDEPVLSVVVDSKPTIDIPADKNRTPIFVHEPTAEEVVGRDTPLPILTQGVCSSVDVVDENQTSPVTLPQQEQEQEPTPQKPTPSHTPKTAAVEEASPDPVMYNDPIEAAASSLAEKDDATNTGREQPTGLDSSSAQPPYPAWPADSAAIRLYDITDKLFRSYAANSLDNAYHCPLLTNIVRKLLPLYEYVTATYVSPSVQRGYVADELKSQTTRNSETGELDGWQRQYVEEQDAQRLFGLPTSHVYQMHPQSQSDNKSDSMGSGRHHQPTLSTAMTGSARGGGSGGSGSGPESHLHSLHQSRFDSSLFNEWLASLLSAALQWALQTDIDEDATDALDGNDFWRYDFARDRHHHANKGQYGHELEIEPSHHSSWEAQWSTSSLESYTPFYYLLDPSVSTSSRGDGSLSPITNPSTPLVASYSIRQHHTTTSNSQQRPAPTALMKGTSRTATVLEHHVLTKALLGRSRVVLVLRLLRAARVSSTFAGTNLAKDFERIRLRCTLQGESVDDSGFVADSDEHNAGRRRCETKLLNAILVCLRTGASDLLESITSAFPSIVGCGLLEPAGRKALERSDEYLVRMLIAAGLKLDEDEEALTFSTSSKSNREILAAAANLGKDAERISDEAIGLFVPSNAGGREVGFGGRTAVRAAGEDQEENDQPRGRRHSHPASAGARIIGAAMSRLELLLRPMRMDLIQREALVVEELSAQIAGEIDVLRHVLVCGVLEELEEEDIHFNSESGSPTGALLLPKAEVGAYLAQATAWCYQHWSTQCRRADRNFRALLDPLLSALDAPRATCSGIITHTTPTPHSPLSPGSIGGGSSWQIHTAASQWSVEVLSTLSWHLDSGYNTPPFPVMNGNFDLREWFDAQERLCSEELKAAAAASSITREANPTNKFASRRIQLVTHPVALALLNRDANAIVELLSVATGITAESDFAASAQYMRDWSYSTSRPRHSVSANNELGFHAPSPLTAFEAHRKDAVAAFHHPAVPQLLHYLPYLSVAFPSKVMPLVLDAFPAISARVLYPAVSSRNRRLRPSNTAQNINTDISTDGTRSTIHNDSAESETNRLPLGGSPMHYDAHQAAASVLNFWLLKAEHESEVAGVSVTSHATETNKGSFAGQILSSEPERTTGLLTSRFNRSNRSVSRRRDSSSLLKLITSTAPFESQSRQDLLDDLCQCVLVVAQQKGSRVMELLTASTHQQSAHGTSHYKGSKGFSESSFGNGSFGIHSTSATISKSATAFNKSFQVTVRTASAAINADPTSEAVAVRETMRVLESSLRYLISFASTKSYWAVGAGTKWSPLTVLSAALERRKMLLEELGDEREALDALLGGTDTFGPLHTGGGGSDLNDSFGSAGNPQRSSKASTADMGNFGSKHNTSPSFFGGLLRKSSMKLQSFRRKEASHQVATESNRAHVDPIYANLGAFAVAKRAQNSKDPTVQHHYNQLLQTQRKIVRVEDSIMVFLSSASLSLADAYHAQFAASIANNFGSNGAPAPVVSQHQSPVEVLVSRTFYPEVLRLLDVYVFPRAVLDLDLVNCFIEDHAKRRAVADLLPLFQTDSGFAADAGAQSTNSVSPSRTPNVSLFSVAGTSTCKLTEQHWISLLTHSHENGCLEAAMMITMTVFVQQPKKARYLLRRAFPLLDFPDQLDPDVKRVAAKFAPILGLKV